MSGSCRERLVLAIETTAPHPGAALARTSDEEVCLLAEEYLKKSPGRAEALSFAIEKVFSGCGVRVEGLAAIAVADGPGSYTGLRVGLGFARGLALIDDLPVAAINSLELIAEAARIDGPRVCAVLDAGRSRVYAAGFERTVNGDGWVETHPPVEIDVSQIDAIVGEWGGDWCVCGDETLGASVRLDATTPPGRAGDLARLGARRLLASRVVSAEEVLPRYVGATGARTNRAGIAVTHALLR